MCKPEIDLALLPPLMFMPWPYKGTCCVAFQWKDHLIDDWPKDCFDECNSGSFCTFQILYTCVVRTDVDNSGQKRAKNKTKWQTIVQGSLLSDQKDQKDQKDQRSTNTLFSHTAIHVPHPIWWAPKKKFTAQTFLNPNCLFSHSHHFLPVWPTS